MKRELIRNALTFDIEDFENSIYLHYFNISMPPSNIVEQLTLKIIDILYELKVKATFFVLGEIVMAFPNVIRRIVSDGHEIAVHGWNHKRVYYMNRFEFSESVGKTKKLIEDMTGVRVLGYRAPAMSIKRNINLYDSLIELGFVYSSSLFTMKGMSLKNVKRHNGIYIISGLNASILEIPLSAVKIFCFNVPILGGSYLRLLPFFVNKIGLKIYERRKKPSVIYIHPYELDILYNPRKLLTKNNDLIKKGLIKLFILSQKINRSKTEYKIKCLSRMSLFGPIRQVFKDDIDTLMRK